MNFQDYFPIWDRLTPQQQRRLLDASVFQTVKRGAMLHNGSMDCAGLLLVRAGQLRAYILSDEGREITIYRPPLRKQTRWKSLMRPSPTIWALIGK